MSIYIKIATCVQNHSLGIFHANIGLRCECYAPSLDLALQSPADSRNDKIYTIKASLAGAAQ
jgi:hypothetical protein